MVNGKRTKRIEKQVERKVVNDLKQRKLAKGGKGPKRPVPTPGMPGVNSRPTGFPPAGAGRPMAASTTPANIAGEQWNHAMSLLNPDDLQYNWAPAAQAVGAPTIVYNTKEVILAGCPGLNPAVGALQQAEMGMGAVVCRPNSLFNHWGWTSGEDTMGYQVGDALMAPMVCVMNPTEGTDAGESFFTLNFSGGLGPNYTTTKGTSVPDWYANAKAEVIQENSSLFRCTSASLSAVYIGPTMLGSGQIVAVPVPRDELIGFSGTSDQTGGVFNAPGFSFYQLQNLYNAFVGPAIEGAHVKYLPYDDKAFEMKPTVFQYEGFTPAVDSLPRAERMRCVSLSPLKGKNAVKTHMQKLVRNNLHATSPTIEYNHEEFDNGKKRVHFSFEEAGSIDACIDFLDSLRWLLDARNRDALVGRRPEAAEKVNTYLKASHHLSLAPAAMFPLLDFFGSSGDVPQPCDIAVDALESASALAAAWVGTGYADDINTNLDTFLQAKSNIDWSYSEPLLVIAWQGCTIDTSSMPAGYTGQMFEIEKWVNYECVANQNTLIAASTGRSANVTVSESALPAVQMAGLIPPAGAGAAPKSTSWGSKLKSALGKGVTFAGKVAGGLGKAAGVVSTISDILAMFA